jgi:hypothetical protein
MTQGRGCISGLPPPRSSQLGVAKLHFEGFGIFMEEVQPRDDSRGVCLTEKGRGLAAPNGQAPVT